MATPPGPPEVRLLDIYTEQVRQGVQLAVLAEQLKALPDHEMRLRALESSRARLYGAAAVIALLVSGGASWVALVALH